MAKFWSEMLQRLTMRNSDIVMVGNPDTGKPEYTTFENLSKNLAKSGGSAKTLKQLDDEKVSIVKGKNLFNVNHPGNKLNHSFNEVYGGAPYANPNYHLTHFIPVESGKTYAISGSRSHAYYTSADYDAIIPNSGSDDALNSTAPAGAKYMLICVYNFNWSGFQVEEGSTNTPFQAYSESVPKSSLEKPLREMMPIDADTYPIGLNILDPAKRRNGFMVLESNGQPYEASWFNSFWYLPVKENTEYSFSGIYQVAWYDLNKSRISQKLASTFEFSPAGAAYASVDYNFSNYPNPIVAEGHIYPLVYEPFTGILANKVRNMFFDLLKKNGSIVQIGDSVTDEIRLNDVRNYYQSKANGIAFGGGAGGPSIPPVPSNTAWGFGALKSVTTGGANTAFGYNALNMLQDGWDNTAFGAGALEKFITGVGNQAMGRLALANLISGGSNTALSDTALEHIAEGNANSALGYGSGVRVVSGNYNNFFGTYAGGWINSNEAGVNRDMSYTIVVGAHSLQRSMSSTGNNIIGTYSANKLLGSNNCVFGFASLQEAANAENNVIIGNTAGNTLTACSNNVVIGRGAGTNAKQKADMSGSVVIGAGAHATRNNEVVIGKRFNTHFTINGVEFSTEQLQALKNLLI